MVERESQKKKGEDQNTGKWQEYHFDQWYDAGREEPEPRKEDGGVSKQRKTFNSLVGKLAHQIVPTFAFNPSPDKNNAPTCISIDPLKEYFVILASSFYDIFQ